MPRAAIPFTIFFGVALQEFILSDFLPLASNPTCCTPFPSNRPDPRPMKTTSFLFKAATLASLLFWSVAHAATVVEVQQLFTTMQIDRVLKTAITEVNSHQLQKRLNAMSAVDASGQRAVLLKDFSALIEKQLDWNVVGPAAAQGFADELSSEEVAQLDRFFKTEAGRYYVEEYQYIAAPVAIAIDDFIDALVDDVMDAPDKPLDVIRSIDANEAVASRLVTRLMSKADVDGFATQRMQFLANASKMTQPKATNKTAVALQKKRMAELGQAFSMEQLNWRTARVISQKIPPAHVKQLLAAFDDTGTLANIRKLENASKKANGLISQQIMNNPAVVELFKRMLKGAE